MGFMLGLPWELGSQLAEDRGDPSLAQSSSAGTARTAAGSWGLSSIPHISELKDKGNMPLTLFPPLHQEGVVIWQLYSSYPSLKAAVTIPEVFLTLSFTTVLQLTSGTSSISPHRA